MTQFKQLALLLLTLLLLFSCTTKTDTVLVFSKTEGFRHSSIEKGVEALKELGKQHNFNVVATEDASYFTQKKLENYSAVIFLNTTGDIFNNVQQAEFERYIQAGGGFVGVHAATDTEYDWPWYNKLVGAYFESHPHIQDATINIIDKSHPSVAHMEDGWIKKDEWYNFKDMNPDVNVILKVDESSYEGGKNGENHPISWYHDYDGGRAFYTEMGHTDETYDNTVFMTHLLGGIKYAIGSNKLDYGLAKTESIPEETRFKREVLDFNLNEPMELDELPGRGILFVERRGALKLYDFKSKSTKVLSNLNLFYGNEDGLLGLAVDPNYEQNNWIYLFYSAPGDKPIQHISRFDLIGDELVLDSEKILLKIPTIRECCHSGGALEFGPNGNLFITTGDNTNPFESDGFAPIDERPGRALWDAQKSAANTNDLRGKILRIKPEDNGSYSIPEDNLFPEGNPKARPEIYAMGLRNPFRPSIDSKTGFLYWGDVGPDAGKSNPNRGPEGMGEFNQARKAGFWGWPYTRGNNKLYNDYDFTLNKSGDKFDPNNIINNSPNNTGLEKLPPVQESLIWYSYAPIEEFPWLGSGGVNPMAGPVFHKSDAPNAKSTFPEYFENKLFVYEWMRDWIYVVTLDENYDYVKADPFMTSDEFSHPMDMIFGSDGSLYVLEYGQKWNSQNMDARLNKISFLEGNREPIAVIENDKKVGGVPLTVQFKGEASKDYDMDDLSYSWSFTSSEEQSIEKNPSFTFETPGTYTVALIVKDNNGKEAVATTKILVGNDAPELSIETEPNDNLYWNNKKVKYKVIVTDKQDGSTENGSIKPEDVTITLNYIPQGKDLIKATVGHQKNTTPIGLQHIDNSDCKACHAADIRVNGPSYIEIANKYNQTDKNYLVSKIIKGGTGVWGESLMSAHPQLKVDDVEKVVDYILSLKEVDKKDDVKLPLEGEIVFNEHLKSNSEGAYVLMASYLDKGNSDIPNAELSVNEHIVFNPPKIEAEKANEKSDGLSSWNAKGQDLIGSIKHNSFLKFNNLNLKEVQKIELNGYFTANYEYKGIIEFREDSVTGKILGSVHVERPKNSNDKFKDYSININSKNKNSTLFIVFKNEQNPDQFIINANSITLKY